MILIILFKLTSIGKKGVFCIVLLTCIIRALLGQLFLISHILQLTTVLQLICRSSATICPPGRICCHSCWKHLSVDILQLSCLFHPVASDVENVLLKSHALCLGSPPPMTYMSDYKDSSCLRSNSRTTLMSHSCSRDS